MHSMTRFFGIRSSLLSARKAATIAVLGAIGFAGPAFGAQLNGGLAAGPIGSSSATASSLTLAGSNLISSATGDFLTLGADDSTLTASTATVSDLSATPTPESIDDYLLIASPGPLPGVPPFDGPGTTPSNRFDFELTSLAETAYNSGSGIASFSGAGIITDSVSPDGYDPTPATFTLSFSSLSPSNYSFTLDTVVPEPTTLGLAAISLGALMMRRRRA